MDTSYISAMPREVFWRPIETFFALYILICFPLMFVFIYCAANHHDSAGYKARHAFKMGCLVLVWAGGVAVDYELDVVVVPLNRASVN